MNAPQRNETTAIILAGGASLRMGTDKAFLEVGGKPLIERVLAAARAVCDHVLIITNSPDAYGHLEAETFTDIHPGLGSMSGLHTGLHYAGTDTVFALGCDMPFIEPRLMEYIISARGDADIAVPVMGKYYEPLFCVYSKTCIDEVERCLRDGRRQIVSFFNRMKLRKVLEHELRAIDPDLDSIMNVNTPEDIDRAELIAKRKKKGPS